MRSKDLIKQIGELINVSPYRLQKILGISKASFYRYASGERELDFNVGIGLIDKMNLGIDKNLIVPKNIGAVSLVNHLNVKSNDIKQKYSNIAFDVKHILEYASSSNEKIEFVLEKFILEKEWKAFYMAFVEYVNLYIYKNKNYLSQSKKFRLSKSWVPFGRLRQYNKDCNPIFAKYNVMLPPGELKWV